MYANPAVGFALPSAGAAAPAPAVRRRENLRGASFRDYSMCRADPWPLARRASIKPLAGAEARQRSAALIMGAGLSTAEPSPTAAIEEIADVLIHQLGFLILHPMAGVRDVLDLKRTGEQPLHPVGQFLR